ncbi:MAG: UDP-N-acetylglucosamine 1-carboxyvinyltransferase, partial [Patescibacteria group bacterium]|nr:UDP-N-acetylglucosamine 1-carboxyvinyltransferase [Patescibacteria group bacterium]
MSYFRIQGGKPLKGKVTILGSKNAAIKMIGASILTSEPLVLSNVPEIEDVTVDLEVVKSLGVSVEKNRNELRLCAQNIEKNKIPPGLSDKTRAAIITLGPLLARKGKVVLSSAGGCDIGKRPIDRHLDALKQLGVEVICEGSVVRARVDRLKGGNIRFEKNTVMGTETAILASVLAEGETRIYGAALEPEVDDLIALLRKMGANINRKEDDPRQVIIEGVESLNGAKHSVLPDRNEAVTYAVAAAATRGDVTLKNVQTEDMTAFMRKLEDAEVPYEVRGRSLRVWAEPSDSFLPVELETAPHPGFMTDWQQPFSVILTQAEGESTIHETIFYNRLDYLFELEKMGAEVEVLTPSEAGM